jgi:hypothetical protein
MNLINKSYFWSYDTENISVNVIAEQVLKYGDISEIKNIIEDYGIDFCLKIWMDKIIPDTRFDRLNYFLARFIFKVSNERNEILHFLTKNKRSRFEKHN